MFNTIMYFYCNLRFSALINTTLINVIKYVVHNIVNHNVCCSIRGNILNVWRIVTKTKIID